MLGLNVILEFFRAMFHLLWFTRRSLSNSLNIYIKSNTGNTLSVELDPKWDIKNVKEVIAPQLGLPPEEVKIILAGKELDDSMLIEDPSPAEAWTEAKNLSQSDPLACPNKNYNFFICFECGILCFRS